MTVRRCARCLRGQLFYEPEPGGSLARTVVGRLVCLHCGESSEVPTPPSRRRKFSFRPAKAGCQPRKKEEAHA